jgi:hypothetical protein
MHISFLIFYPDDSGCMFITKLVEFPRNGVIQKAGGGVVVEALCCRLEGGRFKSG